MWTWLITKPNNKTFTNQFLENYSIIHRVIHNRSMVICITCCNVNLLVFRNFPTKFQNQPNMHLHQNFSKSMFFNLEQPIMKISLCNNTQISYWVGLKCLLTNLLHHHLSFLEKTSNLFIDFPSLASKAHNVSSSFASFTWLYLGSMKMLKGMVGVT